ncbi:MAG: hypothetical protein MI748_20815 [Opitutales bacterium]|nr:hypothetical protein [Opitutales bacterium]
MIDDLEKIPQQIQLRISKTEHLRLIKALEKIRVDKSTALKELSLSLCEYLESNGSKPFRFPPKLTISADEIEKNQETYNKDAALLKAAELIAERTVERMLKNRETKNKSENHLD